MKTLKLTSMLLFIALVLTSCASEDESFLAQEQTAKSLLNSYQIGRNIDGSYFVDYSIKNATSDLVKDEKRNVNNINLYSDNSNSSRSISQDLGYVSNNNELKINFNDTKIDKIVSITVKDDHINFSKEENDLLADFDFQAKEDGTFDLDFSVIENVEVEFIFNEELDSYDIHLTEGNGTDSNFLRTFTPDADGNLNIAFVTDASTSRGTTRKPEIKVGG